MFCLYYYIILYYIIIRYFILKIDFSHLLPDIFIVYIKVFLLTLFYCLVLNFTNMN